MMRYQRVVSPDSHPLSNGKKSSLKTPPPPPPPPCYNGEIAVSTSSSAAIEGGNNNNKGLLRFRSPSHSPPQSDNNHHDTSSRRHESSSPSPNPSPNRGDVLLQWGQKKRARVSRSLADDSSSSSSAQKMRQQPINKVQRRTASSPGGDKLSTTMTTAAATTMPPPPPPPSSTTSGRSANLRNSLLNKDGSGFNHIRNLEERSGAGNGSPSRNSAAANRAVSRSTAGKRSRTPEKVDKKSGSTKDEKPNGSLAQADNGTRVDSASAQSEQELPEAAHVASVTGTGGDQKANVEVIEWPRIYLALSRKEKEEDFMAMKGTKLPHRPKKRAKNIDRTLQYCFPGMWLSDLTKSRYEVREKKCVKKQKRRGLKGMESMDSDSE